MTTDADPESTSQVRSALLWTAVITALHFLVGTRTHSLHGIHILLGSLYLFPILMGAVAWQVRGGLLFALGVSALYALHLRISWAGQALENADQYAMIGVYLFVGLSAGALVKRANVRRRQRDEVIRISARSETVSGLLGLATALGARDPAALRHSERVARLCESMGRHMGLDKDRVRALGLAGLVHDVGKVGVPDDVLFTDSQLTPSQREALHVHVDTAQRMVRSVQGAEEIADVVAAHHESPDGSGYPRGLDASRIPPGARILRVADVFAALTEQRRYKGAIDAASVLEMMRPMVPDKLDAAAFGALASVIQEGQWAASRLHEGG
jgi:putative nucleotidyltransferase with HDIG domain